MKRLIKFASVTIASALLLATSAGAWYALSSPPVQNLPLARGLIDIASAEGQQLLATSQSKTDFAQLTPHLNGQIRRAFCGPATGAAVVNAARKPQPPATQASLFDAAVPGVKSELAVSVSGLTLEELAALLRAQGLQVRLLHASGSDPASFRSTARAMLAEPHTFLVVNYDRRILQQQGAGHISPIGAYDAASDRLLVLDVATQKYPFTWIPTSLLWAAMLTTDAGSGQTRGYLLVTSGGQPNDPSHTFEPRSTGPQT